MKKLLLFILAVLTLQLSAQAQNRQESFDKVQMMMLKNSLSIGTDKDGFLQDNTDSIMQLVSEAGGVKTVCYKTPDSTQNIQLDIDDLDGTMELRHFMASELNNLSNDYVPYAGATKDVSLGEHKISMLFDDSGFQKNHLELSGGLIKLRAESTGYSDDIETVLLPLGIQFQKNYGSVRFIYYPDKTGTLALTSDIPVENNVLKLTPTTPPAAPEKGMIYFDETDNKLKCYDGAGWNDLF